MNLYDRLASFKSDDLLEALDGTGWSDILKSNLGDRELKSLKNTELARVCSVIFGEQILENQGFRKLFLSTLDPEELFQIAQQYTTNAFKDVSTNLLNVSCLPWASNSAILNVYRTRLEFPLDFLPKAPIRQQSQEVARVNIYLNEMFDYQEELRNKICDAVIAGEGNFIVQMPTGAGKTRCMMEALVLLKVRETSKDSNRTKNIMWLAHSTELIEQAIESYCAVWAEKGNVDSRLSRFYSNYTPDFDLEDDLVVFGSLQKLSSQAKNRTKSFLQLQGKLDIIVVDEGHKALAPTYLSAIKKLTIKNNAIVIGVTATPGRSDTEQQQNIDLARVFGRSLLSPNLGKFPIKKLQDMGVLARLKRTPIISNFHFEVEITDDEAEGVDFSKRTREIVSKDLSRNKLIINLIKQEVDKENPCLIFSCGIDHSRTICAGLALGGVKASYVDHTMSKNYRQGVINSFKRGDIDVLVNHSLLTTGFDAPRIKTVIITRPTNSPVLYSQMIGRGLRGPKVGGNNYCNLIDIIDNQTKYSSEHELYSLFDHYWQ